MIDGKPLTEMIASFEREQRFDVVGGYGGTIPQFFKYPPLSRYYVGHDENSDGHWVAEGGIYLLGCSCDEVGCWPLVTRVILGANTVTWDCFRQPYRPERDYSGLGPFVFDLEEYRKAIAEAEKALGERA